jgi:selenocysteine lyase/cysteine desulfurase
VREWQVDPDSGLLNINDLKGLLSENTKFVFVTHCSNIVGSINDIGAISGLVHDAGARLVVDGVSFAPHLAVDVKALNADVYFYSLYKVFGPHQGLMYVRHDLLEELPNQGHFFNATDVTKKLVPSGPMHGEIACISGIVDYLSDAYVHHFGADTTADIRAQIKAIMSLGHQQEIELSNRVLELLRGKDVRIIGESSAVQNQRAPTIAFSPKKVEPEVIAQTLSEQQIGVGASHFYAFRLMQALGIDPDEGVVRISLVHYTSADDVDRLLTALDDIL